jgi:hypothetical protein
MQTKRVHSSEGLGGSWLGVYSRCTISLGELRTTVEYSGTTEGMKYCGIVIVVVDCKGLRMRQTTSVMFKPGPEQPPTSYTTSTRSKLQNSPEIDRSLAYNSIPINVSLNVSPSSSIDDQPTIGLIGMGAMGRMCAQALCLAGWRKFVNETHWRVTRVYRGGCLLRHGLQPQAS